MKQLTPQIISDITKGEYIGDISAQGVRVAGAVRDNRHVKPGNLFVCIRGKNVDGHSFANSAFDAGAACCLAEREIPDAIGPYVLVDSTLEAIQSLAAYYRGLFDIPIIGLTGSVGKTSAKELIAAALGSKLNVLKTQGNLNNELGVPLTLLSLNEQHDVAVIEMGINDFGEMSLLAEMVRPDIFVMTKIGYSHLEKLGDLNGVLRAKSEAFSYMKAGGAAILNGGAAVLNRGAAILSGGAAVLNGSATVLNGSATVLNGGAAVLNGSAAVLNESAAVLNGDDDLLWGYDPGMRKITFGIDKRNDFRAENIHAEGTKAVLCDIASNAGQFPVRIPAYGVHLAQLAAAAAAVGHLFGISGDDISRGLLSYAPVGGRANVADTGYITLINDCYNANPDSVGGALTSLAALPNRCVAILGDMLELGVLSDELHRKTGILAARDGIDNLICCGVNAALIYEGYKSAGGKAARYYHDKAELIAALPELIKKGDAVLVKASRGMKFEEIVSFLQEM